MGCDQLGLSPHCEGIKFQSTHPRGVRPRFGFRLHYFLQYFNPRTHVGCDARTRTREPFFMNFNPRTHVGCDRWRLGEIPEHQDFNPRTHVGCDLRELFSSRVDENFNPRTHVGCDGGQPGRGRQYGISIHAPTWGATIHDKARLRTRGDFNPRTHVGCD